MGETEKEESFSTRQKLSRPLMALLNEMIAPGN
jgi:hypothetical protein